MKTRLLLFAVLTLCFCGCAKQQIDSAGSVTSIDSPVFTAGFNDAVVKTSIDDQLHLYWTADDRISIFTDTYNHQYRFTGQTGDNSGDFEEVTAEDFHSGSDLSTNYAIYPYNPLTTVSYDRTVSIVLPSVQNYGEKSFGVGANTMIAVTDGPDDHFLGFKNVCGFLIVKMYGEATIGSISIMGNNGEKISGQATAVAVYGQNPAIEMDETATESITIDCGDGVTLGTTAETATEFWFCIPPTTFSEGFTITVNSIDGKTLSRSTSSVRTITRNEINSMAEIPFSSATVACELIIDGKSTQKATVNEAFTAALAQDKPATVKVLADCALLDSIHMEGPHEFTLDLNGHTLTTPGSKVFRVWNQSVLTIKSSREGGMMFESSTGSNSMFVRSGGKVILESGCLKGNNSSAVHIYIKGDPGNLAVFEMNGGEIWTPNYNPVTTFSNSKFIMNGGTLRTGKVETYCINIDGNSIAEFYGGTFKSITPEYGVHVRSNGEATFNGNFENLALAGGFIFIEGGNYTGATYTKAKLFIKDGIFTNNENAEALIVDGGYTCISGGTFSAHSAYGTIHVNGTALIDNWPVINNIGEDGYALYVGSDSKKGTLTINGGKITGFENAYVNSGSLSVLGGTFKSNKRSIYVASNGVASISGGYFETPADSVIFTGATGMVSGGWFTQPVPDTLIDGAYKLDSSSPVTVEGVTYNHQVIVNPDAKDILSVNGTPYKTIGAAVNAINEATEKGATTIKVLEDCSSTPFESPIEISGSYAITFDLNGKICGIPLESTAANLKITDNSTDALGQLTAADGVCPLTIRAGATTMDKGTIFGVKKVAVMVRGIDSKATFNFNSGEIKSSTEMITNSEPDAGAVCVIDNSEFNMSGGIIRNSSKRALWCRSITSGTVPYCNIHDGVLVSENGNVFYVYTRAHINIDGGLFIGKGSYAVGHNGHSNTEIEININGGYFTCGKSYDWSGFDATSVERYFFTGGHYTRSPEMYNSNTSASTAVSPVAGYAVATMATPETKTFEGVTYTFTHEITTE